MSQTCRRSTPARCPTCAAAVKGAIDSLPLRGKLLLESFAAQRSAECGSHNCSTTMRKNNGKFSGDPATRWITDSASPDRNMEVLADFSYIDPDGNPWQAPSGTVVDGASIPRVLWTIVGSPYTGDYRRASIVHDKATEDPALPAKKRKAADRMYYHACLCGGCSKWEAIVQYLGVRIGAWIPSVALLAPSELEAKTASGRFKKEAAEVSIVATFYEIAARLEPDYEQMEIEDVEAMVDQFLRQKARLLTSAP